MLSTGLEFGALAFIDQLGDAHRTLFVEAAEQLTLLKGHYLLRRGEPGGDVFLVKSGTFEVVDSRSTPEVILAVLEAGAMVGEMAFVDNSPRSADVRSVGKSEVLRWGRDDLRKLLTRHPEFAASFYKNLARLASDRIRAVTTTAVAGAISGRDNVNAAGLASVKGQARLVAEQAKSAFIINETRLRQSPADALAVLALQEALDALQRGVHSLFTSHPDPEEGAEAADTLHRELNPYLVRSSLADRCIRRDDAMTGTAEILAHVLVNQANGDGRLGEILDRWLLDRPTLTALRALREPLIQSVQASLPLHRNRRVMLVNAGTGSLVAGMMKVLSHPPTILTVVDQSREALGYLDDGFASRDVGLQPVQENLAQFAMGRFRHSYSRQDVVILYGLLEYLPDRLAVSLLHVTRKLLTPEGSVLVSALAPSADKILLDRLLAWPTIRRSRAALHALIEAAGLRVADEPELAGPALLARATP